MTSFYQHSRAENNKGYKTWQISTKLKGLCIFAKTTKLIDGHYTKYPFKGAERMYIWLTMDKHYKVNRNRIERLYYKIMGLRAIMPGRHTTKRNKANKIYPICYGT